MPPSQLRFAHSPTQPVAPLWQYPAGVAATAMVARLEPLVAAHSKTGPARRIPARRVLEVRLARVETVRAVAEAVPVGHKQHQERSAVAPHPDRKLLHLHVSSQQAPVPTFQNQLPSAPLPF